MTETVSDALTVRPARAGDGAAVAALHNPIIRDTVWTFTDRERTAEEVDAAIGSGQPHWLAFGADGAALGFATFFSFRAGPGYARCFEHTVVLAPAARRQGGGRALMAALEAGARAAGGHGLVAAVAGGNPEGVAFHGALGFVEVGRLREAGWKFGRYHDLILMQKMLLAPGRVA